VKKILKFAGIVACSLSLLVMSGGHLFALQSLAWARMMVEFSNTDSLQSALSKTFSGQYPCPLCLKVQKSWREQQQQEKDLPGLQMQAMPEVVWNFRLLTIPEAPKLVIDEGAFAAEFFYHLSQSPPKPPPRA
jgi:hypothetical protein